MSELLLRGADPHAVSHQQRTPLHEACVRGISITLSTIFKFRLEKSQI